MSDLGTAEIIGQLWLANRLLEGERPVTNVVMMGMGEPLLNLDNVIPALRLMLDDNAYGLSRRRVTLSTAGVIPGMDRLRDECPVALALSLHAPNDALRDQLVPVNRKYPLRELLAACNRYLEKAPRDFITLEYVMLEGVNDADAHARELVGVARHVRCKFNLIPFNPFPHSGFRRSSPERIRRCAKIHTELAAQYYSRGNMGVALEELRIAAAADSSYAPTQSMFGLVYMDLRENQLAESSFERALRLSPNDPDINHNYGVFLCQTQREGQAIAYFLQAIRNPLYAAPWRSYSAAGVCTLRTNNLKDAEEFFKRALRLDPEEAISLLSLGQIRYRQGSLDEARKLVSQHNKLVAPSAESLWLALRIERKLGERVAEQSYANQLRRRFPGSPEYQALQRGSFD